MHREIPFGIDDPQAWYSFVVIEGAARPQDRDETCGTVPPGASAAAILHRGGRGRIGARGQPAIPLIDRVSECGRTTLRALLLAACLAAPVALVAASPAAAEKVIRPQGGGPAYMGSIGPWDFYKIEFADGVTSCSMLGWVGRARAPTFGLAAYYTKAGKFDGSEIRFEGIPGNPPTGDAARAELRIGGRVFAMEHPERLAHTGFFLKDWNQADTVIETLTALSGAKGNRSFSVVQGGRTYKFDARDFGKALGRLKEKCGFGK